MIITVRGRRAFIAKGASFDYVSENRLFSGADDYTLTITFPLADCPANIAIFGHLNRADVEKGRCVLDCEIIDKAFAKSGSLVVSEVSETSVKAQFLEGRTEQNFDTSLDSVYINEVVLSDGDGAPDGPNTGGVGASRGEVFPGAIAGNGNRPGGSIGDSNGRRPPVPTPDNSVRPADAWSAENDYVALPWVNNETGIMQNEAVWDAEGGAYRWKDESKDLSWQMYLLPMAKAFCEAVGYSFDFGQWENSPYRYLLCCNTLPQAWGVKEVARALPHWTVAEFFEKLELLMCGEFDIDHRAKRVTFAFSADVCASIPEVAVDNVLDAFSAEVAVDDKDADSEYLRAKNLAFADSGHSTWTYESCHWYMKTIDRKEWLTGDFDNVKMLAAAWIDMCETHRNVTIRYHSEAPMLRYAMEEDLYMTIRCVDRVLEKMKPITFSYRYVLQPLNRFGPLVINEAEDADSEEIEFVPVPVDYTDREHGFVMFLPGSSFDEPAPPDLSDSDAGKVDGFYQPYTILALNEGEPSEKAEYFSVIYTAFFDGTVPDNHHMPIPATDSVLMYADWSFVKKPFSLRINAKAGEPSLYRRAIPEIDAAVKYKFSFLADTLPNPRAVFNIRGKRYVCEKLTASFSESGMSQLVKGEFYLVRD